MLMKNNVSKYYKKIEIFKLERSMYLVMEWIWIGETFKDT